MQCQRRMGEGGKAGRHLCALQKRPLDSLLKLKTGTTVQPSCSHSLRFFFSPADIPAGPRGGPQGRGRERLQRPTGHATGSGDAHRDRQACLCRIRTLVMV